MANGFKLRDWPISFDVETRFEPGRFERLYGMRVVPPIGTPVYFNIDGVTSTTKPLETSNGLRVGDICQDVHLFNNSGREYVEVRILAVETAGDKVRVEYIKQGPGNSRSHPTLWWPSSHYKLLNRPNQKETPKMKQINWDKPLEGAYGHVEGMKAEVYHVDPNGTRWVKYVDSRGRYVSFDSPDAYGRSGNKVIVRNKVEKFTRYALKQVNVTSEEDRGLYTHRLWDTKAEAEAYARERSPISGRTMIAIPVSWEE